MSVSWETECHVLYEDIKKQTLLIKEQQEEINRLTIAYQNASDQRQHYVDKCLMLSEVVLEFDKLIDSYFEESIKRVDNLDDQDQMAIFLDHKYGDLICKLKRNLKDKSE